jgi:hypothetical protein
MDNQVEPRRYGVKLDEPAERKVARTTGPIEGSLSESSTKRSLADEIRGTLDAISVRRVFGDPYVADGVTIVPVARVTGAAGGGGGGEGTGPGSTGGRMAVTANFSYNSVAGDAPAVSPAIPATRTADRAPLAAATPTMRLAVEIRPSLAPSTAARNQAALPPTCRSANK